MRTFGICGKVSHHCQIKVLRVAVRGKFTSWKCIHAWTSFLIVPSLWSKPLFALMQVRENQFTCSFFERGDCLWSLLDFIAHRAWYLQGAASFLSWNDQWAVLAHSQGMSCITAVAIPFKMFICFQCFEISGSITRSLEKDRADLCHQNCWIVSQYYTACPKWLLRELWYLRKQALVVEILPSVLNCTLYQWKVTIIFEFAVLNYSFVVGFFFSFFFLFGCGAVGGPEVSDRIYIYSSANVTICSQGRLVWINITQRNRKSQRFKNIFVHVSFWPAVNPKLINSQSIEFLCWKSHGGN